MFMSADEAWTKDEMNSFVSIPFIYPIKINRTSKMTIEKNQQEDLLPRIALICLLNDRLTHHCSSICTFSPCLHQAFCKSTTSSRWPRCCLPLWSGSGTACLSLRPPTTSRTKSFRKLRDTSKVSPKNWDSFQTAVHLELVPTMSSRSNALI